MNKLKKEGVNYSETKYFFEALRKDRKAVKQLIEECLSFLKVQQTDEIIEWYYHQKRRQWLD